jgi:predicted AAA+ superfamily ATPase
MLRKRHGLIAGRISSCWRSWPRQVGKTTLAEEIAASVKPEPIYLDLERPSEAARLNEPEEYFELHKGKLIILDEIQRVPELFQILRGVIDRRRREVLELANSSF